MVMFKLRDALQPLHKQDAERHDKAQKEALDVRQELKDIGQRCMLDPKFVKYREAFEKLERLTVKQARYYRNADPIQYAMVISNMLTELNTFEALIEDVTTDAQKKMPVPVEKKVTDVA